MLGHDPDFDRREDCYSGANDHMHRHRGGSLEAQYPRRNQSPQSHDEIQPLLPDCEGRKGRDGLRRDYGRLIHDSVTEIGRRQVSFDEARDIAERILVLYQAGRFDVATIIYNRFRSAMTQIVTAHQLIPFQTAAAGEEVALAGAIYEFEPSEEEILAELLPKNLAVQIYTALLENAASEQGARMTAMDNATRNAGEMIDRLTLNYNRTRQAAITKELIEIISGAEAL